MGNVPAVSIPFTFSNVPNFLLSHFRTNEERRVLHCRRVSSYVPLSTSCFVSKKFPALSGIHIFSNYYF